MSIETRIKEIIEVTADNSVLVLSDQTTLIGEGGIFDSIKLVELCVRLEDLADENGFEYDWSSDSAMSSTRSIYKNTSTIIDEFLRQMSEKASK